ncbi:retrovirus-related pol polyprotein from transposon TNT 1-94, partial [Tanacetum coccineum]
TVWFGNDQFAPILGYGDLVQGNITINRVYYFKGLTHNLFSVGQFCDANLAAAFQKSMCFVRDLQGNDLLTGNCEYDLYTISLQETTSSTPICLMAKASPTQGWLWHRRLSHHNFDYINLLSKKDVVIGLPKLKYVKDQLCTEFLNKTVHAFFKEEGIEHQTSTLRTPEQNGTVKRRNRTLVEAARTMLLAFKLPLFFWAEAIATVCYTQNISIIILTHAKTAYHIINDRKPSIKHIHIFGYTCYLTRDGENMDKMKEKGDPFDEIKEMSETSVANDTSGLVPQRQKTSDYDNSGPVPQLQKVFPSADTTVPSQQELWNLLKKWCDLHGLEAITGRLHHLTDPSLELVDKPFGKNVIKLKWLWKNKKDKDQTGAYRGVTQNVARAYVDGPGEKREYAGTLPLCNKCKFHHNGACASKCTNCKRVGHLARDYRSPTDVNTQRAPGTVQKTGTCFEYGSQGHFKRDCPKLKNQNRGNAAGDNEARKRAYALGGGEPNPDSNVVTGTFLLNNRYASF